MGRTRNDPISQWTRQVNALSAEMGASAAALHCTVHPSAWNEALTDPHEEYLHLERRGIRSIDEDDLCACGHARSEHLDGDGPCAWMWNGETDDRDRFDCKCPGFVKAHWAG